MLAAQRSATIITRNDKQGIGNLLNECGIWQNEIDKIVDEGFESMNKLIRQYESIIEGFKLYLKSINKAFRRNPIQTDRI